jgi:glycosyltransferase involved in cell wall biosynthesis
LLLVGDGAEREALRERADVLGLGEGSVRFVGEVDDVRPYLWATDVFVLPSREEGLSLALLEAMAAGACVIVTDLPGHRDVVTDGETGYRVPVGDAGALREALDRSFASSELRSALGDGARRWVLEHASLARTSEAHTELYSGLRRRGSDRPARAPVS